MSALGDDIGFPNEDAGPSLLPGEDLGVRNETAGVWAASPEVSGHAYIVERACRVFENLPLYLGSRETAFDTEWLAKHKISHCINVTRELPFSPGLLALDPDNNKRIPVEDNEEAPLYEYVLATLFSFFFFAFPQFY